MKVIKNIIFDIGNVILEFDLSKVLPAFTDNRDEQKFILDNIINSPEWLQYGLIDTGYISRDEAISIVQDRTNHVKDDLIVRFWNCYNEYALLNEDVLRLINNLKNNGYRIYLLSNINPYTFNTIKDSKLFNMVDGYVLSYVEHKIKPYIGIYKVLLDKYNLDVGECLFIDDNEKNVATASSLGITSYKVEPDNYESVIDALKNNNIQID